MNRYLLTDEAKQDLVEIRHYLQDEAGAQMALSVVRKIRETFLFLSRTPGAGHSREDLTIASVKFWPVFSYLIVYDSDPRPIVILRVLHGSREVAAILEDGSDFRT